MTAGTGATVTGSGSIANPYVVSADNPDCSVVRACISATTGIAYDPVTGVITADLSGDAGNILTLGGDGGLYAAESAVDCADVRPCISATSGAAYNPATGVITADVSGTAGNQLVVDGDGLYVPPAAVDCTAVRACLSGVNGVTYVPATGVISADVSDTAGNQLVLDAGGLYVPPLDCADVRPCISATGGAAYDPVTGVITADLSGDAGNQLVLGGDGGLYVPPGAVDCTAVRTCLSGTNGVTYDPVTGVISADVSGTAGNQLVLDAGGLYVPPLDCADVRPCLSGTNGVTYDPVTGVISADVSGTAGNQLVLDAGGLFVPPAAALVTGCGLDGAGTALDPLVANVGAWPYPCSVNTFGGVVACDASGVLRSEPRGMVSFTSFQEVRNYADLAVPAGFDQPGDSFSTMITNPDTCRSAFVLVEREADVDFNLPAGAGAAYGHGTDEMYYTRNNGATTILDAHVHTTKVFGLAALLGPGASTNLTFDVTLGRGSAGATYNRIQVFIRAMMISL
ncbi:hypothetical protein ACKI16_29320 [Streptomyces scabiei]|uniref:hypothetical protein n=1 Tax=Streptomyces scabiei TaxID=1930 RepID=UPI0038F6732F